MNERIALIFDTNFIVSHISKMEEVYNELSKIYNVFISEVSNQERISHRYLELKEKYGKIEKFSTDFADLIEISIKKPFEERYESAKRKFYKSYHDLFGDNIIKLSVNKDTLNLILDRVFKKIPPFSSAENASDKGFKDTLIWLSILEYFRYKGEHYVIFVTDDKIFKNNADALCKEFTEYTGKKIEIKNNNFFEMPPEKIEEPKASLTKPLPDVTLLREKIQENISALRFYYEYDQWGNDESYPTFELKAKLTPMDMKFIFENLRKVIELNIFESSLSAETAFGINDINCKYPISMFALQNVLSLYEEICKDCKEYLPQFYSAAANNFNMNYDESKYFTDDIPF